MSNSDADLVFHVPGNIYGLRITYRRETPESAGVFEWATYDPLRGELFEQMMDGPRYVSHFATCPNIEKHRRPKS